MLSVKVYSTHTRYSSKRTVANFSERQNVLAFCLHGVHMPLGTLTLVSETCYTPLMSVHAIGNNAGDNRDEVIIVSRKITNALKINEQKKIVILS